MIEFLIESDYELNWVKLSWILDWIWDWTDYITTKCYLAMIDRNNDWDNNQYHEKNDNKDINKIIINNNSIFIKNNH